MKVTAKPVTVIDENILTILDDMMETMYHANGIGLAATQIAVDKRLIVMDCGKTKFETQNISEEEYNEKMKDEQIEPNPIKMINPEIISLGEQSSILTASSLAAKPPKTTECTAPILDIAKTAIIASGIMGI